MHLFSLAQLILFFLLWAMLFRRDYWVGTTFTVIHTGLRGFARNNRNNADTEVKYRVCQEGIQYLVPHMKKRIYYVNQDDFRTSLATPGKTMHLSTFSNDLAEQVRSVSPGAIVLVFDPTKFNISIENEQDITSQPMPNFAAVMWKCRGDSLDCLVAKVEIDGLISMLDSMKGI
jgi:hypothetical protein